MAQRTEKELDQALEQEFKRSPEFVRWFLSHTKFASESAEYLWSRADHPWGKVPVELIDEATRPPVKTLLSSERARLIFWSYLKRAFIGSRYTSRTNWRTASSQSSSLNCTERVPSIG